MDVGDFGGDFGDGGSGGSGGGGGNDKVGGGGTGGGSGPVRKLYSSTKIVARLVKPWNDKSREWMERSNRESACEKAEDSEGTFNRAANEPSGNTSIPVLVKLLSGGLCAEQGEGDIDIYEGVYYKRAELWRLQYYYDLSYMFDPQNIEVVFGETSVKIDGGVHVVKSVDHGKYTLGGRESTII
ncbi:unnamed protein product [Pylaiella littoralis]